MKCLELCRATNSACQNEDCRLWINYKEDLNCVDEAVRKNGPLTLRQVSERFNVSFVRIKQIEDKALKKVRQFIKRNFF